MDVLALPANDDALLSRRELATILKLSEATLRNWASRRTGPPFLRVGPRRVAYRTGDVRQSFQGVGPARSPKALSALRQTKNPSHFIAPWRNSVHNEQGSHQNRATPAKAGAYGTHGFRPSGRSGRAHCTESSVYI